MEEKPGTLQEKEGYIDFIGTNDSTIYVKASKNVIDWRNFKYLKINIKPYNKLFWYDSYGGVGIDIINSKTNFTNDTTDYSNRLVASNYVRAPMDTIVTISVELPDEYVDNTYVAIRIHRCYAKIYDIWLER